MPGKVDLGGGHSFTFTTAHGIEGYVGILEYHECKGQPDVECGAGSVLFDLPSVREKWPRSNVWQLESLEPLTLSPSIACTLCDNHGWIRQGRWVDA